MDSALQRLLLNHPPGIPSELLDAIAARVEPRRAFGYTPLLADRPELSAYAVGLLVQRCTDWQTRVRLLARQDLHTPEQLHAALTDLRRMKRQGGTAQAVRDCMANPYISPALVELFRTSNRSDVVAGYAAAVSSNGPECAAALARLDDLLGEDRKVSDNVSLLTARTFRRMLLTRGQLARSVFLGWRNRALILAAADEAVPGIVARAQDLPSGWDSECTEHLFRQAVLPVLRQPRPTGKDKVTVIAILRRFVETLPLPLLAEVAQTGERVAQEWLARRNPVEVTIADKSLGELSSMTDHDAPSAARWLVDQLAEPAAKMGWAAVLEVLSAVDENVPAVDACAAVAASANPSQTDSRI